MPSSNPSELSEGLPWLEAHCLYGCRRKTAEQSRGWPFFLMRTCSNSLSKSTVPFADFGLLWTCLQGQPSTNLVESKQCGEWSKCLSKPSQGKLCCISRAIDSSNRYCWVAWQRKVWVPGSIARLHRLLHDKQTSVKHLINSLMLWIILSVNLVP